MEPKVFYVHNRVIKNGVMHGIAYNDVVFQNFKEAFGEDKCYQFIEFIDNQDQFYIIEKFGSFVGFILYDKSVGISMRLSDFDNNLDLVLDEYLSLEIIGWDKEKREQYVKCVVEIKESGIQKSIMELCPFDDDL